jgi:hypothetical protein
VVLKSIVATVSRLALAVACLSSITANVALSKQFGPEQAAELLAKTSAADIKCNVLSAVQRDQLQIYLAQAEISLAEKTSVLVTRTALERGGNLGKKVACDATTKKAVEGVFLAAHETLKKSAPTGESAPVEQIAEPNDNQALAEPIAEEPIVVPPKAANKSAAKKIDIEHKTIVHKGKVAGKPIKPEEPVTTASVKPSETLKPAAKPSPKRVVPSKTLKELDAYAAMARDYYIELKCRRMSKSNVSAFYKDVLRNHKQAVSVAGGSKVAAVLRKAQSQANSKSCS